MAEEGGGEFLAEDVILDERSSNFVGDHGMILGGAETRHQSMCTIVEQVRL